MANHPSQKQTDANRRNALRSTGPKTEAGKGRSRRNGLKHGFAAEAILPEINSDDLNLALERWQREAGPDNVFEEHMVRKAAVGSVNLDRIDEARESTRTEAARDALNDWERSRQHAARRRGQDLRKDPVGVVADLQQTAFGCDWLIRQWEQLDASLRIGGPWDRPAVDRAQHLLGLPEGVPGIDAEDEVRLLWILAGTLAPGSLPVVPRIGHECGLPSDPIPARAALRAFVSEQIDHLLDLREESWNAVEGPEARAIALQHAAADTSRDGQLRHRYATLADRSCNAAVRLYLNVRDRRRRYLLDIAREARRNDTPRAPVGNGWWREPDSAPAPPGFRKLTPAELDDLARAPSPTPNYADDPSAYAPPPSPSVPLEDPEPTDSCDLPALDRVNSPEPVPASETPEAPAITPPAIADTTPPSPSPVDRPPSVGHPSEPGKPIAPTPARSEPISTPATSTNPERNLDQERSLHPGDHSRLPDDRLRTLPVLPARFPSNSSPESGPFAPPRRPDRSRRDR